ncbi:Adenine phosphoribosyltransferase [Halotydeus destructor]|nr:Adenine phosphoribosyltransferase [Halotydeus destructor]
MAPGEESTDARIERFKKLIKAYDDFPKKGILFRDFLPILQDPKALEDLVNLLVEDVKKNAPDANVIVGLESRGFLLGPLVSLKLGLPFVPIRKAGKLPGECEKLAYELEYGSDVFEVQKEAIKAGSKCVLIDDLLATGGSLRTSINLINKCNGNVVRALVIIELLELGGRSKLEPVPVYSVIAY